MDIETILKVLNGGGMVGALVLIIFGGARKLWVFGWIYQEKVEEVKAWKDLALRNSSIAQKVVQ